MHDHNGQAVLLVLDEKNSPVKQYIPSLYTGVRLTPQNAPACDPRTVSNFLLTLARSTGDERILFRGPHLFGTHVQQMGKKGRPSIYFVLLGSKSHRSEVEKHLVLKLDMSGSHELCK